MDELTEKLIRADEVCNQTNGYLEEADRIESRKEKIVNKLMKADKVLSFIIGFLSWEIIGRALLKFHMNILGIIPPVLGISIGILFHKYAAGGLINRVSSGYDRKIQEQQGVAQGIFEENYDDMAFLPEEYWYPLATSYLINIAKTGRCRDLNEALDKFDEQLHRWKLEETNSEILAQQQLQTANLRSINTSSGINAAANVMNAIINLDRSL